MRDTINKNTKIAIRNIERSQQILDRLIRSSENVRELRKIKKKLATLTLDLTDENLGKFSNKTSSMNDFTTAEDNFILAVEEFVEELEKQSTQGVNVKNITLLLDAVEDGISSRLIPTDELEIQFRDSIENDEPIAELIPQDVKNELHLYLNMLQTKYSKNRPEILFCGDYIGDMNWKYVQKHDNIKARLGSLLEATLALEARYQQKDIHLVEQIQKEANNVKKGQHKCVCLINKTWDDEIKDFTMRFVHPHFVLYLYDLEEGLMLNTENKMAEHYAFWFNSEQDKTKLDKLIDEFIENHEYFTIQEIGGATGLNNKGTVKKMNGLIEDEKIVDVSFGPGQNPKYTKLIKKEN